MLNQSTLSLPTNPFLIALLILCVFFSGILMYSYVSLSLMIIAGRVKTGPLWWAWVPIFNVLLMLRIAGRPLWWLFLFLLPLVNIILSIVVYCEVARSIKEPSWVGILILVPFVNMFVPGYLAYRANKSIVPFVLFGTSVLFGVIAVVLLFVSFFTNGKGTNGSLFSLKPTATKMVSSLGGPMYTNEPYGFSLSMTPSWAGYRVEDAQSPDEFAVGQLRFYYRPPSYESMSEDGTSQSIGMNLFVIDVYPLENWYWVEAQCELREIPLCGKEIGTNESYAFVYSHINGDPPASMSPEVLQDMTRIMESFVPKTPQRKLSDEALQELRTERLNRFKTSAIEYQNCKHGYVISYPMDFSNNGMTSESDLAVMNGMGLTVTIEATYNSRGMTLQDFAQERLKTVKGRQEGMLDTTRNGIPFLLYQFAEPASSVSFWIKDPYVYEIRYDGTNYEGMRRVVKNISGTLNANNPEVCQRAVPVSSQVRECSHPNGDVDFWWYDAPQESRDCYISKYGYPALTPQGDAGYEEWPEGDHPNGDIEFW